MMEMAKLRERLATHWQDAATLLLGVWLVVSPWVLGYGDQTGPAWNAHIVGIVIVALMVAALWAERKWAEWLAMAIGLWLILSPWILAYSAIQTATWNQVVVGAVIGGLVLWKAAIDRESGGWFATKS